MKEQEPKGKDELTRQDNQPRLNGEGASMTEGNSEIPTPPGNEGQINGEEALESSPQDRTGEQGISKRVPPSFARPTKEEVGSFYERLLSGADPKTIDAEYKAMCLRQSFFLDEDIRGEVGKEKGNLVDDLAERVSDQVFEKVAIKESMYDSMRARGKEPSPSELPTNQLIEIRKRINSLDDLDLIVKEYRIEEAERSAIEEGIKKGEKIKLKIHPETDLGILKELIDYSITLEVKKITDPKKRELMLERLNRVNETLRSLVSADNPSSVIEVDEFKETIMELIDGDKKVSGLIDVFRAIEKDEEGNLPHCLEDLVGSIMVTERDEFKKGEKFELLTINKETGEEEVNIENFTTWIRSKILYWHSFNSTSEVNLFSEISVYKLYRQINFGEMLYDPRYFMRRHVDENGQVTYRRDEKFEALKDHLLYEVWLFMISHNADIKYNNVKGNDSKLPETIMELYYNNYFTNSKSRLLKILKLPEVNIDEETFKNCIKEKDAKQGKVGKAIRRALLAYYHMGEIGHESDENMFEKSLSGENGEGIKEFYRVIYSKLYDIDKKPCPEGIRDIKEKIKIGLQKRGYKNLTALNIFNAIEKETEIIGWVREAVARAVAKAEKLEDEEGIEYESVLSANIGYAENWAYSMTYWTGLAARNDTGAVGFDAWSKLQNFLGYRISQLGMERGGKGNYGNVFNFFGINRICLNFWEGITATEGNLSEKIKKGENRDTHTYSMLHFLQGGDGTEINLGEIDDFEFKTNAQRQFAINHIMYGYAVYTHLMKEHGLNLEEILSYDSFGKVIVKEKDAREKLWDGIVKQLRYTYDMQGFKWLKKERGVTWSIGKNGRPEPKFETKELEKLVFNDEVLEASVAMMARFEEKYPEIKEKRYKVRGIFAYLLAKELKEHRRFFSSEPHRILSIQQVLAIKNYLKNRVVGLIMPEISKPEEKEDEEGVGVFVKDEVVSEKLFDEEEYKMIEQRSKTEFSRMFRNAIGSNFASGSVSGFFEALKIFFNELLRF